MKALVFAGQVRCERDYPMPVPASDEALIAVTLTGICHTDLEITRGYAEFQGVLGHEFVGIVKEAPAKELIGHRVVGEINCVCEACDLCRRGLSAHCPNRTVLGIVGRDGAMAEFVTLPTSNLHLVPDDLSDEEAVFTEPLAAALQILEQVHSRPTQRVAVLGDGKLGLLVAQVLSLSGGDVIAIGHHPAKLAILQDVGIPVWNSDELEKGVFDMVIECTGRSAGLLTARQLVRPRGTIILKSTFAGDARFSFSPLVVDEVNILGSRCGPFGPALRLLRRGLVSVKPMITGVYSLEDGEEAFRRAADHASLKVLVRPA